MHVYPSHVYVLMTLKIFPYVHKWIFPLFFICLLPNFSWNNAISLHTISSTTLICTTTTKNDILDRLSNGDMNLSYVASISLSLIPSQISCSPNKCWPFCFKMLMVFCQTKWYAPILIFLMDVLLAPWSGQAQLTSLSNECQKKDFINQTSQGTLFPRCFLHIRLLIIISTSSRKCG